MRQDTPKLWLQYSDDNAFFDDSLAFLQKIGFASLLSIDMAVKYSFQKANRATMIQGAEIDTYDNDHLVNDTFFVHKMVVPKQKPLTHALVTVRLNTKKSLSAKNIADFVRSMPMLGLFIFFVISLFIPGIVGKILRIVNGIALGIFVLYYLYKFLEYSFKITSADHKMLNDHMVTYLNPKDLSIFTPEVKEKIWLLAENGVTDIAIDRNMLYLKQDLIDDSERSILMRLFSRRKVFEEKKKDELIQKIFDLLSQQEFLTMFQEPHED